MIAEPVGSYPHITVGDDRAPSITGTTTKVIEIALDRIAYHWDADEIQLQHSHLRLAQIHDALAYYYDHQSELDAVIAAKLESVT
ncbi:MAG: DUF433 domain-containing protein, partial [Planctomycetales bacterium]|nr:DUF433 domain-containing protein [Planctomycetales bacterium]